MDIIDMRIVEYQHARTPIGPDLTFGHVTQVATVAVIRAFLE